MEKYDAIVVGAGLGGLSCGALLARSGKRVLVLEQHYVPGGYTTTFKRKGFTFEVSLHEIDGMVEGDETYRVFRELGIFNGVELLPVKHFYHLITPDTDYLMERDVDKVIADLSGRFPGEEKGIRRFFEEMEGIGRDVSRMPRNKVLRILSFMLFPLIYPRIFFNTYRTVGQFLDANIKGPGLKAILAANMGYYGHDAYKLSFLYFSIPQWNYFSKGGYFVKGGSQKLADHLVSVIKENGGEVKLRHEVTKVHTSGGKVSGVAFRKVTRGAPVLNAEADTVVLNSSLPDAVETLAPELKNTPFGKKALSMELPSSHFIIYAGLNRPLTELGIKDYNTFIWDEPFSSLSDYAPEPGPEFKHTGYCITDYGMVDDSLAPEGKDVISITTTDFLENWTGLTEEEYYAKKDRMARELFHRIEKRFPGFIDSLEHYEAATPKTLVRYTRNRGGSAYGYAQSPGQTPPMRPGPKTPIKGLYVASAWGNPGGGVSAVILSGSEAAAEILG